MISLVQRLRDFSSYRYKIRRGNLLIGHVNNIKKKLNRLNITPSENMEFSDWSWSENLKNKKMGLILLLVQIWQEDIIGLKVLRFQFL